MALIRHGLSQYQCGSLAILFASVLWGTTGTVASLAPNISPLAIGAFAMGVGGVIQAVLAYQALTLNLAKLLKHKRMLLLSAVALAVYPLAFYSAMRLAGVAVGTVVSIASAPLFAALLERLLSKQYNLTRRWVVGVIIGLTGIGMLAYGEPHLSEVPLAEQIRQEQQLWGVGLGFVAGLTYAFYSWAARTLIDKGVQSQAAMGSIFGLGALLLLPTLAFTGDNLFSSTGNIIVSLYMAMIPMALGYMAFGFGLRHIKASSASLLTLLEPVVAAILAVIIVGEIITPMGWFGMILILFCLCLQAVQKEPL